MLIAVARRVSIVSILSIMGFLVLGKPVWSDGLVANVSWSISAIGCGTHPQLSNNLLAGNGAISGDVGNSCIIPKAGIDSVADAQFNAQPFDLPNPFILHTVDATANTTGPGVAAIADVSAEEEVTIDPPPNSPDTTATVQAGDAYEIFISREGLPFQTAQGLVSITFDPVFGSPLFAQQIERVNGNFSGPLLTPELTAFGCPCKFTFTVRTEAEAANGSSATVADPAPFLILPAGWTYVFSAPPAPLPEPSSLALISGVLVLLFAAAKWRHHQR
jgi:hypothetical protein